jgi:transcriptional regulator with XRE-family HTH domain
MSKTTKINSRRGSSLDDFLKEEGIYTKVVAQGEKEILAWKLQSAMQKMKMTISTLAKKMKTSRAAINRILDPANPSVTLVTLEKAAFALGKRWRFDLVDIESASEKTSKRFYWLGKTHAFRSPKQGTKPKRSPIKTY